MSFIHWIKKGWFCTTATFNSLQWPKQRTWIFPISKLVCKRFKIYFYTTFTFGSFHSQASDGWIYYFKKEHNIVDRHIDKVCVAKPDDDEAKLDDSIEKFKLEQMPIIAAYPPNKVFKRKIWEIVIYWNLKLYSYISRFGMPIKWDYSWKYLQVVH